MKISILFALLLVLTIPLTTQAEEKKMFERKPKHVIFLIHGIGGNKTHFGYMAKALPKILNKKDPSTRYLVRSIEYNTGNNEKTAYDFAQDVDLMIKRVTTSGKFREDDKISLIMHSQGGLIGSIWMFQSMLSTPGYSTPETIKHLDSFITLGTPFWGAKTAQWGSELKDLTNRLKVDVPLPYGKKELEQMSFGSDMIFDFRMAMMDPQFQAPIDYLREHVRFLNIVGVADLLNPLGIFVSGTGQYEDDGAVPLASARFNFLYSQSVDQDYSEGERLLLKNSQEIEMAPYVVVNAMHRSPLPEVVNFAGIAQIPKACIDKEDCGHPSFPYLWNHILGNPVRQIDERLGDYKTFLLDLNVRVDSDQVYACEDLTIAVKKLDGSPLKNSNIEISKFYEMYSSGSKRSEKHTNHCRFYYTGSIKKTLEGRTEAVLLELSGSGLKKRFIEVPLKPSYSSFVDVRLQRKGRGPA